jgi:hypothetical protein
VGCAGSSATFQVSAAGQTQSGAQALGYAWRRNGVALGDGPTGSGSVVSGAFTPALSIAGLSPADAGTYDCEVANACGTTLSAAAALTLSGGGCPTIYCTPKAALVCGTPAIHYTGFPSAAAASGFEVRSAPARAARLGVLVYGNQGRAALPFQGGILCVLAPSRGVPASSWGTPGACDGAFAMDVNAFAHGLLGGHPKAFLLVPGTVVDVQWWGRDTLATGSHLSDALEYTVAP